MFEMPDALAIMSVCGVVIAGILSRQKKPPSEEHASGVCLAHSGIVSDIGAIQKTLARVETKLDQVLENGFMAKEEFDEYRTVTRNSQPGRPA